MSIVKLSRNFGSNQALIAGLSVARTDAVVVIAADLQNPPELIEQMIALWQSGVKVVLAARDERDDPPMTAFLADVFYWFFRRFALPNMPKRGYDFFLIDRQLVDIIKGIQENNPFLIGLILWMGFKPHVLYYHRLKREERYGRSAWTLGKRLNYFVDSFVAFSYFPVRAASLLGVTLSFLGGLYALWIVIARLLFGSPIEGWASLMVVLLIVSGAQMLMMGILGEYLWRNLDETRKRPRFIIEAVERADAPP